MSAPGSIFRFLCSLVLLYGILIIPWPGFNGAYSAYLRTLLRSTFGETRGRRVLKFEAYRGDSSPIDTVIVMSNRDRMGADGRGLARVLELDARSVGWVPTAMFLALGLSTPFPIKRRIFALLCGLILVHAYILFAVGCYIWNQSTELGILTLSPFCKAVFAGLEETLVTQLGVSFVVPVLIWIVFSFRTQDLETLWGKASKAR